MADVTVYKPAAVTVDVIDGPPPVDQTALVASLQAQVATLQASLATALGKLTQIRALAA